MPLTHYQYRGKTYALSADLTPEQALAKIKAHDGGGEAAPAPEAPQAAAEPSLPADVEGQGPVERFLSGLIVRPIKGLASAGAEMAKAGAGLRPDMSPAPGGPMQSQAQMLRNTLKGIGGESVDELSKAKAIHDQAQDGERFAPETIAGEAGHTLAAIPVLGPMIRDLVERARAGDVAGAVGETAFNAIPWGRVAEGVAGPVARGLESSAAKNIMNAVNPGARDALRFRDIAPRVAEDLGVGGREKILGRAEGQLSAAGDALGDVANSPVRFDLQKAVDELTARSKGRSITSPAGEEIPLSPKLQKAYTDRATSIDEINQKFGGQVPAADVVKMKSNFSESAEMGGAYNKMKGQKVKAGAMADRDADAIVKEMITGQIPDAKKAYQAYSDWKKTRDLLSKQLGKDVAPGQINGFMTSAMGRLAATGALKGAAIGGLAASMGAGLGVGSLLAVGSGTLMITAKQSAFWNTLSGSVKRSVAKSIKAGSYTAAQSQLENAAKAYIASEQGRERKRNVEGKLRSALGIEEGGTP